MPADGPGWISFSCGDGQDGHTSCKWKFFGFQTMRHNGTCPFSYLFELFPVWSALVFENIAVKLHLSRAVPQMKRTLVIVCEALGSTFEDCFIPSRQSWPKDEVQTAYVRQEWQVSFQGILALVFSWETRHIVADRLRARDALEGFLEKVLGHNVVVGVGAADIPANVRAICPCVVPGDDSCRHVKALSAYEATLEGVLSKSLLQLMRFLYAQRHYCPTLVTWLAQVTEKVTHHVHNYCENLPNAEPMKDAIMSVNARGNKRRVDEDYKATMRAKVMAGKAGNPMIMARALGDVSATAASQWYEHFLCEYAPQGHITFTMAEECGLVFDGARLGHPAEERIVWQLERLDTGEAMWLPPSAPNLLSPVAP